MTMQLSARTRQFVAWALLVAITVVYLWFDHSAEEGGAPAASVAVTVSAIVLALVKFRVVLREFMDVRHAPRALRRMTDLLVAMIGFSLLASYLVGRAVA